MSDSLNKFAEELKAKREEKNITLASIYEKTRIDSNYLGEMEKGNFNFMPDLYVRAFIRKYADAIDFSPEEALKMYDAALKGKTLEELSEDESDGGNTETRSENDDKKNENQDYSELAKKGNNKNLIPIIVLLVVIVASALGYFYFFENGSEEIIVEPKIEEIIEEQQTNNDTPRFEVNDEKTVVPIKIAKEDSLSLIINANDTIWFRIMIDDEKNDEFILNPNHSKKFVAGTKFNLLLGNAGAIELILNGKNLNFTGKKGAIRNINIDANGFQYVKNSVKNDE